MSGSYPDNSDNQVDSTGIPIPPRVFQFDAHKPTKLNYVSDTGVFNVATAAPWGCQRNYSYQLVDDGSKNMGAVYIVERWDKAWGDTSFYIWPPSSQSPGMITDSFNTGQVSQQYLYNGGSGSPVYGPLNHYYFAATTDTNYYNPNGSQSGILVLQVVLNMWTDMILNK